MKLEVAQLSDTGRSRDHNEDSLGSFRPVNEAQRRRQGDLFLVADGLGGHEAGEVASGQAVTRIIQEYAGYSGDDVEASLRQALELANADIYAQARASDASRKMATTLVGAVVRDRELHVVNVGDSRAYLLRGRRLEQLTEDHSLAAEQVREGLITAEQARDHVFRSTLTRALGTQPTAEVDYFRRDLKAGDRVLLCSDGLTAVLPEAEIRDVLADYAPAEAVQRLVDAANERGGPDNITVIIIRVMAERVSALPRPGRRIWLLGLGMLGFPLAVALGYLVVRSTFSFEPPGYVPQVRPVLYRVQAGQQAEDVARLFGYDSYVAMAAANGLGAFAEGLELLIQPFKPSCYLAGRVADLRPVEGGYRFQLITAARDYRVFCPPGGQINQAARLREADEVTLFGEGCGGEAEVQAELVDVSKLWGFSWYNWYYRYQGDRVWVYGVLAPSPYGFLSDYQAYGSVGDPVLAWGRWLGQPGQIASFEVEEVYRLDGGRYIQATR